MPGAAHATEFMLSADDFDADTAALYGLVNRSIPDTELDDYILPARSPDRELQPGCDRHGQELPHQDLCPSHCPRIWPTRP